MTACEDNARVTGIVSLFCGIETATWSLQDFKDCVSFALNHGITTLFIKVFEVGSPNSDSQGFWYGGLTKWANIYAQIQPLINIIPYGFLYGNNDVEISTATRLLQDYGKLCLDIEGSTWVGKASQAAKLAQVLEPIPGKLWLSYPANFDKQGIKDVITALAPATDIFMPMAYNDFLMNLTWNTSLSLKPNICIQPTIDLSQEFGANQVLSNVTYFLKHGCLSISLWYEQFAKQDTTLVNDIVKLVSGNRLPSKPTLVLNKDMCVCDVLRTFQLEIEGLPNVPSSPQGMEESQDLCGPWSVASLKYAGPPNKGPKGTYEDIDRYADNEADKWLGSHQGHLGSTVENMHAFLHDAGLHYWDFTPDIPAIRAAIQAGYPVLAIANEQNIIEKRTGKNAYPWVLNATHVFPICGIDKDGDFIVYDELNNEFQGYWPPVYLASILAPTWASAIQLVGPNPDNPWLKPIPSNNPLDWQNFNAQLYKETIQVDYQLQAAMNVWNAIRLDCPFNTGFSNEWLKAYRSGDFKGPPLTQEKDGVNWQGQKIKFQVFCKGQYELSSGVIKWYAY